MKAIDLLKLLTANPEALVQVDDVIGFVHDVTGTQVVETTDDAGKPVRVVLIQFGG